MTEPSSDTLTVLLESVTALVLELRQQNRLVLELVEQNGDLIQMHLQKDDEDDPQKDLSGRPLFND